MRRIKGLLFVVLLSACGAETTNTSAQGGSAGNTNTAAGGGGAGGTSAGSGAAGGGTTSTSGTSACGERTECATEAGEGCALCAFEGPCKAQHAACEAVGCFEVEDCLTSCVDEACTQQCIANDYDQAVVYYDLIDCSVCTECPLQCGSLSPWWYCEGSPPYDVCGDTPTCDACKTCAADGPCKAKSYACNDNSECQDYFQCISLCNDAVCESACKEQYPTGAALFEDYATCALCDMCPTQCPGEQLVDCQ